MHTEPAVQQAQSIRDPARANETPAHAPPVTRPCTAADYWSGPTWTGLLVPVLVGSSTLVAVIVKVPSLPK